MDYQGQQQAAGPAVGEIEETNADLLKVTENAQLFLGKTGYLSPGQYAEFWLGPKIASLGTVLLSRILMTLTGEDKTSSLGEIVKKITSNAIPPVPDLTKLPELDAEDIHNPPRTDAFVTILGQLFLFSNSMQYFYYLSLDRHFEISTAWCDWVIFVSPSPVADHFWRF